MDAADITTTNDWFNTHSRYSYEMRKDPAYKRAFEAENQALEAAVDTRRITREILVYVLAQPGSSASGSTYCSSTTTLASSARTLMSSRPER